MLNKCVFVNVIIIDVIILYSLYRIYKLQKRKEKDKIEEIIKSPSIEDFGEFDKNHIYNSDEETE